MKHECKTIEYPLEMESVLGDKLYDPRTKCIYAQCSSTVLGRSVNGRIKWIKSKKDELQ